MGDSMKKIHKLKRKKYTTNTYMREAIDYNIFIINEIDFFITIKKYKKVSSSFRIKYDNNTEVDYIKDGYYVIEITPLKENYNIRYYVNSNKEIIDYYIDITYENGVEYKIPYYIDLYLDIIHNPIDDSVKFCDEEELLEALNNKIINKKDYDFAYKIGNKLLDEIKSKSNKYLNIDILKYLENINEEM